MLYTASGGGGGEEDGPRAAGTQSEPSPAAEHTAQAHEERGYYMASIHTNMTRNTLYPFQNICGKSPKAACNKMQSTDAGYGCVLISNILYI